MPFKHNMGKHYTNLKRSPSGDIPILSGFDLVYENGRISANNGPIWKIRNLAYSWQWWLPVEHDPYDARDVAREMTSRARECHERPTILEANNVVPLSKASPVTNVLLATSNMEDL